MTGDEAKAFLLTQQSYCSIELPPYFTFTELLKVVDTRLTGRNLSDFKDAPSNFDGVNHIALNNKDGKYAWRPLEIIHPALYVSLVHKITEGETWQSILNRFGEFTSDEHITCLSLPVESLTDERDPAEQIRKWWETIEEKSIELFLDSHIMGTSHETQSEEQSNWQESSRECYRHSYPRHATGTE